ncbi:MAG: ATP-binding protein [Acholeplasmataceae bacterium]|nr:ATP-binding protein [Acholeplasmataceae bacterium]
MMEKFLLDDFLEDIDVEPQPQEKASKRNAKPLTEVSAIKKIKIKKFRQFNNVEIPIAQQVTAIAGHNATGKSTLLALIGNSCELKSSGIAKPLIKEQYRAELGQIIKCSLENDTNVNPAMVIDFTLPNNNTIEVPFRFGWWENKTRPRLVPKYNNSESKMKYPVLYLGLSRLQPLGECEGNVTSSKVSAFLASNQAYKDWLIEKYEHILSLNNINDIETHKHPDAKQKIFVGVKNDEYDELCNSAGQDNLGQILLAFLSFKNLKKFYIENSMQWNGGFLLIDELDATLHPSAQVRLLNTLVNEITENDLKIQLLFTTHSLSLLEWFYNQKRLTGNSNKVLYLTTRNSILEILENPDFETVRADMLVLDPSAQAQTIINLYAEDNEGRWLLKHLASEEDLRKLKLINIKISCDTLIKLNEEAPEDFANAIILIDGDCKSKYNGKKVPFNILILPGVKSPEELIYEYMLSLPPTHTIWSNPNNVAFSYRSFKDFGPNSSKYKDLKEKREKYKKWFIDNQTIFEEQRIMDFWKDDNKSEYNHFVENLRKITSVLQKKKNIK